MKSKIFVGIFIFFICVYVWPAECFGETVGTTDVEGTTDLEETTDAPETTDVLETTEVGTELSLYARSAVLIDAESGRVLYGKNIHDEIPIASTTKIMTCIIALEYGKLDDTVKISDYAASMPDVQLNIKEGEEYKLGDLLYSLMLESHNDVAVAIAEHVGGSVEGFAKLMNDKAKDIGAFESNFVTPNGLDADNQYSTAYDMALIGAYAIKNTKFLEIVNTRNYSLSTIDGSRRFDLANKDAFLSQMEGALGIKTGFTSKAGYCFVGALKRDNKTFISVVLASGGNKTCKWTDTRNLMMYGINNYSYKVLFEPAKNYKVMEVEDGKISSVDTYIDGSFSALMNENESAEYFYNYPEKLQAPIKKGQIIGTVEITIDKEPVWSYPIRAKNSVEKIDLEFCLKKILKLVI